MFPTHRAVRALGLTAFFLSWFAAPTGATPQLLKASALVFDAGFPSLGGTNEGHAFCVAAGDLDGDGRADLVVTHYRDSFLEPKLTVLRSTDHPLLPPLFRPASTYATGGTSIWVEIADLNGDTKPDLVTANTNNTLSVLFNTGGGTFGAPTLYALSWLPRRVAVADFNGDLHPDLALSGGGGTLAVLLGSGGGLFGPPTYYSGGSERSLAVGDVDSDGRLDLVAGQSGGGFDVLLGNGSGAFGSPTTWATANAPADLLIHDMNGDGRPDVVVAASPDNLIQVHLNDGGSFPLATAYSIPAEEESPSSIAMADLDGDGQSELVVGYYSFVGARSVAVIPRDPAGTLIWPIFYDGGHSSHVIRTGDFDGDGQLDVASAMGYDVVIGGHVSAAYVQLGNGDRTLGQGTNVPITGALYAACSDDFNRDGKPDLATATDDGAVIQPGNGSAAYGRPTATIGGATYVISGDVTRDGKPDLLTHDPAGIVNVWQGAGNGTFPANWGVVSGYFLMARSLIDLNRDGTLDLVLRGNGNFIYVTLGNGAGGFALVPTSVSVAGEVNDFVAGDWNRDGKVDLAVATSNGISLLAGNGSGGFASGGTLQSGKLYDTVGMGDLNRDGKDDLLARASSSGNGQTWESVDIFPGNGLGGFGARVPVDTMHRVGFFIDSWDVNRDGSPDLIAQEYGKGWNHESSIAVWLGNGSGAVAQRSNYRSGGTGMSTFVGRIEADLDGQPDLIGCLWDYDPMNTVDSYATILRGHALPYPGTLGGKTDYPTLAQAQAAATGDLNRDGVLDLVAVCNGASSISVLLGTGSGTFGAATSFAVSAGPCDLVLADFNRDGILDCGAVSTLASTQTVSVLLGTGTGAFGAKTDFATGPMGADDHIVAADVNRDGSLDLITSGYGSQAFVLLGNGAGAFGASIAHNFGSTFTSQTRVADMNRDGFSDLVTTDGEGATITVSLGNGTGTFGGPLVTPVGDEIYGLVIQDFNRDGVPDVAGSCLTGTQDYIAILLGNGSGGFPVKYQYAVPLSPSDVAATDANGDGILDLAVTSASVNQLSLLLGAGNGTFQPPASYLTASFPSGVAFGDFDRDGRVDFASANRSSNNISVLLTSDQLTTGAPVAGAPVATARLLQNAPNPFNPRTSIRFAIPRATRATLRVYDAAGRRVANLLDQALPAGTHTIEWDGKDTHGRAAASGVYFYRLEAGEFAESRRMVLLK